MLSENVVIMSTKEFERFRENLKNEIIAEVKSTPFHQKNSALYEVQKVFSGSDGLLRKEMGNHHAFRAWDAIRILTTQIMGKSRVDELQEHEVERARKIAKKLCEYALLEHENNVKFASATVTTIDSKYNL